MKIDYIGVLKEAWVVVRANRGLWGLGLVQMAFTLVYGLVMLVAILPIVFGASMYQQAQIQPEISSELLAFADLYSENYALIIAVTVMLFMLMIVTGIFQVAAYGGTIVQVDRARDGAKASFADGMREGMQRWWRTAGLLAISAIPNLVYMFALSLVGFFTLSLPAIRGGAPDMAGLMLGQTIISPLAVLSGLVSIPLALVVQLSLRYALLVGQDWKAALKSGWQLMKARLGAVALMFLSIYVVALIASFGVQIIMVLVSLIAVPIIVFSAVSQSAAGMVVGGAIAVIGVSAVMLVYGMLFEPFNSAVFTIFWRQLTPGYVSQVAPSPSEPVMATVQPASSWTE